MATEILIVDDDRATTTALQARLTDRGFVTKTAASGRDAIALFEKHRPAVVLMDAAMPDISGFDVCRHIRAADPDRQSRVIFLSGAATPSPEYVSRCAWASEADDYVPKPFDFDRLLGVIERCLQRNLDRESVP